MENLRKRAENARYYFYSFSGGRDSAFAMYLTIDKFKNMGKEIAAIFVDNGDEFPDLVEHVKKVCSYLHVKLIILHGDNFVTAYGASKKSPDSIHMDCIERLINKPMDKYMMEHTSGEDYVLIRGGKSNQKRPESGTKLFQTVKNKPQMVIYNPLYEYDTSEIDEETADFLTWDGYKKGFVRTACWCCPFQKPEQWVALREHYPELHERLKRMFMTYTFVLHPNDGHIRYIADYWIKKEFTPVKFEYAAKRKAALEKQRDRTDV